MSQAVSEQDLPCEHCGDQRPEVPNSRTIELWELTLKIESTYDKCPHCSKEWVSSDRLQSDDVSMALHLIEMGNKSGWAWNLCRKVLGIRAKAIAPELDTDFDSVMAQAKNEEDAPAAWWSLLEPRVREAYASLTSPATITLVS